MTPLSCLRTRVLVALAAAASARAAGPTLNIRDYDAKNDVAAPAGIYVLTLEAPAEKEK